MSDGPRRRRDAWIGLVIRATSLLSVLPCGAGALAAGAPSPASAVQEPPGGAPPPASPPPSVEELARRVIAGEPDALAQLSARRVPDLVRAREALVGDSEKGLWRKVVRAAVRRELRRVDAAEPGVRYHGQLAHLAPLGRDALDVLLELLQDEDAPRRTRLLAAGGLGDLGDPAALPVARRIVTDILTEEWLEETAGFLMARLGDRSYVERQMERHQRVLAGPVAAATLPDRIGAHGALAEIHYRVEDYAAAVRHYRSEVAILEDLRLRLAPELRGAVTVEIETLHYNLACSLSLAGDFPAAVEALQLALRSPQITPEMVLADGDLRAVRGTERFREWWRAREAEGNPTVTPDGPMRPAPRRSDPGGAAGRDPSPAAREGSLHLRAC